MMLTARRPLTLLLAPALALLLPLVGGLGGPATEDPDALAPTSSQRKATRAILERLDRAHYRDVEVDDALSGVLFERYLDFLDPNRAFLLTSDLAALEEHRYELDDALVDGELESAFEIFRLFQERRIARYERLVARIEQGIDDVDLEDDEWIELDRSEAAWFATMAEADDYWRRRFENDVLNLVLAEREPERIAEILTRRYENQLERAQQTRGTDVFSIFLNAFLQSYDPHTNYFAPRDAENFDIQMSLRLEGIGALLGNDGDYVRVERIIPGGPADENGLLEATDRILAVGQGEEGESVNIVGWRTDEAVDLIRGPKGTTVRLTILDADLNDHSAADEIAIVRDEVKLEEQAASSSIVDMDGENGSYRVGVIDLPTFYMDFAAYNAGDPNYKSSTRDVARIVEELKAEEVDGIVLDLRGNGGGSLTEAKELSGLFLGEGPVVQVREPDGRVAVLVNDSQPAWDGPLVVLVDRLSASASEIFAGAVQDYGRGVVVGQGTFGKGTVQAVLPVGYGQLKLTQAKFYRVSGASTQSRGVQPDIAFPPIFDPEEIGESSYDETLPWDQIDAFAHNSSEEITRLLPKLTARHTKRTSTDPEFRYLAARTAHFDERRDKTRLSLTVERRRAEREAAEAALLAIENEKRVAEGLEPVDDLEDVDEEATAGDGDDTADSPDSPGAPDAPGAIDVPGHGDDDEELDAYAREAGRILVDLIELAGLRFAYESGR